MPETPDFDQIALTIVETLLERAGEDLIRPNSQSKALAQLDVSRQLRLMWNARGAADVAKLEIEIPKVWTAAAPAGPLTRALQTLDC